MFSLPPLRRTYDAAMRDLRATKPAVRASAAHDLGLVGDENPRAASDALVALLDDTWSEVRGAALTALGTLRARHHAERMATLLDDGDSNVRQLAVVALAEAGGARALELLREALAHDHADVRYQALLGVLSLDPAEGFRACLDALASDDPWIASEAAEQLGRLFAVDPDQRTENALDDAARTRCLDALHTACAATSERVKVAAAIACARMGERDAVPVLCEFVRGLRQVEGGDLDAYLHESLELLGAVSPDDVPMARETLSSVAWRVIPSPARSVARASLARLGDERACNEIVEQLHSLLPGRREAAVKLVRVARLTAAEGTLLDLLDGGSVEATIVLDALSVVGTSRSRTALSRLARTHDRSDVRDAARRALARIEATP